MTLINANAKHVLTLGCWGITRAIWSGYEMAGKVAYDEWHLANHTLTLSIKEDKTFFLNILSGLSVNGTEKVLCKE